MTGSRALSISWEMTEAAWAEAAAARYDDEDGDGGVDPFYWAPMDGLFDVRVGDTVVVHRDPTSITNVAAQLAEALTGGFPVTVSRWVIDDTEGGWSLELSCDREREIVVLTELDRGHTAEASIHELQPAIEAFVRSFAKEANERIPDMTGWEGLSVLAPFVTRP
jgi:hypothetical protein